MRVSQNPNSRPRRTRQWTQRQYRHKSTIRSPNWFIPKPGRNYFRLSNKTNTVQSCWKAKDEIRKFLFSRFQNCGNFYLVGQFQYIDWKKHFGNYLINKVATWVYDKVSWLLFLLLLLFPKPRLLHSSACNSTVAPKMTWILTKHHLTLIKSTPDGLIKKWTPQKIYYDFSKKNTASTLTSWWINIYIYTPSICSDLVL